MRQDIVILRDGFTQFQVKYKVIAYCVENQWHMSNVYFVRTIQNLWRIGMRMFGRWSGVEHSGGGVLVSLRMCVLSNRIRDLGGRWTCALFQPSLRYTFDHLRHLSTFVCKSLLTYMPSRIDFSVAYPEYDLYGSVPGTK